METPGENGLPCAHSPSAELSQPFPAGLQAHFSLCAVLKRGSRGAETSSYSKPITSGMFRKYPRERIPSGKGGDTGWQLNPSALTTGSADVGPDTVRRATGGQGEGVSTSPQKPLLASPSPGLKGIEPPGPSLPETQRHALVQRVEKAGHGPHTGVPGPPRPLSLSPGCGRFLGVLSRRPPTSLR